MLTYASPLKLCINRRNNFACLTHVMLIFTSRYPQLDSADPNLRNLLLSEFEDLEYVLQKTSCCVSMLLEEHLRLFLHCVKCHVLCRIAASVA